MDFDASRSRLTSAPGCTPRHMPRMSARDLYGGRLRFVPGISLLLDKVNTGPDLLAGRVAGDPSVLQRDIL